MIGGRKNKKKTLELKDRAFLSLSFIYVKINYTKK